MMHTKRYFLATWLAVILLSSSSARTAVITDLFNTGVNNFAAALPSGSIDGHYAITSPAQNAVVPFSIPTSWVPDNSGSRWIVPASNQGFTTFTYQTTFTLPSSAIPSSVVITGLWGTDNPGTDLRVNGSSTGLTNTVQFTALTPFTLDSSNSTFLIGTNTIEFDVMNVSGPSGLRVDRVVGTFVPEPIGLMVLGPLGLALRRRRRLLA